MTTDAEVEEPMPQDLGFEPIYDPEERVAATVRIDATPGGKRFQGVYLDTEDGRTFVVAYRPDDAWRALEGERVRATGRPYTPGANTQHVSGAHFAVDDVVPLSIDAPSWTGPEERVRGILVREPMGPPGSKLEAELAWWLSPDGESERLLVVGADEGLAALDGEEVEATGRRVKPSPYVAHLGVVHFEVSEVSPAP